MPTSFGPVISIGRLGSAVLMLALVCGAPGISVAQDAAVGPAETAPAAITIVGDSAPDGAAPGGAAYTKRMMAIKIYNNTSKYNIYPVINSGGATSVDPYARSAFKIKKADWPEFPYPTANQFRLYINPTGDGIPPGEFVVVRLPLFTQLVRTVDPKQPDNFINWWAGGRVELFDAPASDHKPPKAIRDLYPNKPGQTRVTPIATAVLPTCPKCQRLQIFKDPAGLKNNEPSQLTEFTLGALNHDTDPEILDDRNVDYDVSYVDTTYMPAAMGAVGNSQVGYIGMLTPIDKFRKALQKFLDEDSPFHGWPQYKTDDGELILKVPSALQVLGNPTSPIFSKGPWKPITRMRKDWDDCIKRDEKGEFCDRARDVNALFEANYRSYRVNFKKPTSNCNEAKGPIPLTDDLLYAHVQGFTPFVENCLNPKMNLLADTPGYDDNQSQGYRQTKNKFDALQYWPGGKFNGYTELIHGEKYINAPYVYAYSVDDAVGNMQAEGVGIVIAIGGPRGLENTNPASPPVHISFGFSPDDKVQFVKYGICSEKPDRDVNPYFHSFDIAQDSIPDCVSSLLDSNGVVYKVGLDRKPPYPNVHQRTPETHKPVDCSVNKSALTLEWCSTAFAHQVFDPDSAKFGNFLILAAPKQPPR